MANTVKPTGLTIARKNLSFTFSWKIADKDYGAGQELQYRTNLMKEGKWTSITIGTTATQKAVSLTAADYNPTTSKKLTSITFKVRGKRRQYTEGTGDKQKTYTPDWSAWSQKTFSMTVPVVPSLTATLSTQNANVTTFSWSLNNDNTSNRPFTHVQYQSIRVKDSTVTDGSTLKWKTTADGWATGTGTSNSSHTFTEDTTLLAKNSYTRWVRVRARGASGDSDWRYAKHVYAKPNKAETKSATASQNDNATTVTVEWKAASNAANPIDSTIVQYAIATPAAGQSVPSGQSWTNANSTKDTGGKDAAKFTIDTVVGLDQCLWTRIATTHDTNVTYSAPTLVKSGKLTKPTNLTAEVNAQTYRATVAATNNSAVPDSKLAVIYRDGDGDDLVVGVIPHGSSSVTVQCPIWTDSNDVSFGVYAYQGSETYSTVNSVRKYAISANMRSNTLYAGGDVPSAPSDVSVSASDTVGEVYLTWKWSWRKATSAEISWSQNPNAWNSTTDPQVYTVSNLNAGKWYVSDLEMGKKWYFRVRLTAPRSGGLSYGPYSDVVEIDLTTKPVTPVLTLSDSVITADGNVTASWVFVTDDGTEQGGAIVCLATIIDGVISYGNVIASLTTEQSVLLQEDWTYGQTYYFCVKVTSEGGRQSEWSDPVPLQIAEAVSCTITSTSLVSQTITVDGVDFPENSLTSMPLSVTVTGADEGGTATLIVERAADYHMIRPDDTEADGYEGETIFIARQSGTASFVLGIDDLIGVLDDGAPYRNIATVEDEYGQKAEADPVNFNVRWSHQADVPSGSETPDGLISKISPVAPSGYATGDVCDIYRLSADRPELIVQNGEFGTTYVDPYPALGDYGHRIVHRTANGDYITQNMQPAWFDTSATIDKRSIIIDFNGIQAAIPYNVNLSSRWNKDFKVTNYLGGAQAGDWNPIVSRTATYTAILPSDDDSVEYIRALAAYTGICHIRTPEGSSYACNVDVTENVTHHSENKVSFTLAVTRVDPQGFDGVTLEDWENESE